MFCSTELVLFKYWALYSRMAVFGTLGGNAVFVVSASAWFEFAASDEFGHFGFDADHGDDGCGTDLLDIFGLFVAGPSVVHPDFCFCWGCGALDGPSGVF